MRASERLPTGMYGPFERRRSGSGAGTKSLADNVHYVKLNGRGMPPLPARRCPQPMPVWEADVVPSWPVCALLGVLRRGQAPRATGQDPIAPRLSALVWKSSPHCGQSSRPVAVTSREQNQEDSTSTARPASRRPSPIRLASATRSSMTNTRTCTLCPRPDDIHLTTTVGLL